MAINFPSENLTDGLEHNVGDDIWVYDSANNSWTLLAKATGDFLSLAADAGPQVV